MNFPLAQYPRKREQLLMGIQASLSAHPSGYSLLFARLMSASTYCKVDTVRGRETVVAYLRLYKRHRPLLSGIRTQSLISIPRHNASEP
jgi:hypothetical protein